MKHELTIRLSNERDSVALGRLAQLDSTLYDGSQMLVAESSGRVLAAVALDGQTRFADPFERTAETLAVLDLRCRQLAASKSVSDAGPRLRRLPASA